MSSELPGCCYCFRTLDPQDKDRKLRIFVKCDQCNAIYHTVCRTQIEKCLNCGNDQTQPIEISSRTPLLTVTKMNAIPIEPSALAFSTGRRGIVVPTFIYKELLPALQNNKVFKSISEHLPSKFKNPEIIIVLVILIMISMFTMCSSCCLINLVVDAIR